MNTRTVDLDLTTVDGNAFALLAAFRRQAMREGWPAADINAVLDDARSRDYAHLVATLARHCDGGAWDGEGAE